MTAPHGPYASRAQAALDAAPLRAAIQEADPGGPMTGQTRAERHATVTAYIDQMLFSRGVPLSAYDAIVIDWLARWEPETIQVILGWVDRAHADGFRTGSAA